MEVGPEEKLQGFVVGDVPTLYYIPDFLTHPQHDQLLDHIYQAPAFKWKTLKNRRLQNWGGVVHEKGLLAQELPPWLTNITQKIFDESRMFPSAINHVLINEYQPNQGIMPHQDGPAYFPVVAIVSLGSPVVMDFSPHLGLTNSTNQSGNGMEDIVSGTGAPDRNLQKTYKPFSVLLMPRSLLIFKDKAYSEYMHGIEDIPVQRGDRVVNVGEFLKYHGANQITGSEDLCEGTDVDLNSIRRTTNRISLTCRVVPKVNKKLFKF
ncbi:hypothetical protein DCAR_0831153 [Daucus carota subsp. sativus]|uniref:Fe2OG dioxygenase domain-containing protein n=1 Tax=Daucus carota subsp. sativus TaxID=79200 RepID=A0A175YL44_DAUCS|nr:PREDICTED: alpha-ketoglutarate-dependent dioxygenase alkB homolog 6 [Daucus carota subsp. sativus]WOH11663.1 hypothetical protein DCAR_0831153 [Daucus carota subsp. sativus]